MRTEEGVGAIIVALVVFSIGASLAAPALAPEPTPQEIRELGKLVKWITGNVTVAPNVSAFSPGTAGEWTIELDPQDARVLEIRVGTGEVSFRLSDSPGGRVVVEIDGVGEQEAPGEISVGMGEVKVYVPPGFAFDSLQVEVGMGDVWGTVPLSASGAASVKVGVGEVSLTLAPQSSNGVATIVVSGMGSARAEGFDSVSESPRQTQATLGSGQGFTLEVRIGTGDAKVRVSRP